MENSNLAEEDAKLDAIVVSKVNLLNFPNDNLISGNNLNVPHHQSNDHLKLNSGHSENNLSGLQKFVLLYLFIAKL